MQDAVRGRHREKGKSERRNPDGAVRDIPTLVAQRQQHQRQFTHLAQIQRRQQAHSKPLPHAVQWREHR